MKNIIKKSNSWRNEDTFNAQVSGSLQDIAGKTVTVKAVAVGEDLYKQTGEIRQVGFMVLDDGTIYSTISNAASEQLAAVCDMIDETGGSVDITVEMRNCKNNGSRKFIALRMA